MNIIAKQIHDLQTYGWEILKVKFGNRFSFPFVAFKLRWVTYLAKRNKQKIILIINGAQGTVSEVHRVFHLTDKLKVLNIAYVVVSSNILSLLNIDLMDKFDLLFIHRSAIELGLREIVNRYKKMQKPIIYDVDDLVFDVEKVKNSQFKPIKVFSYEDFLIKVDESLQLMKIADIVLVPTDFLKKYITKKFNLKTAVLRNHLDQRSLVIAGEIKAQRKIDDVVTIGYFPGTATHQKDFLSIEKVLMELLEKNENLRLKIVGPLQIENVPERIKDQIKKQKRVPYKKLMYTYADVDINVAPLEINNDFCEGKSELKYFFAGSVGIPTIASATDAFKHAIINGKNGFLCQDDKDWQKYLRLLVENGQLRREMGEAAFEQVWQEYTPENQAQALKKILSGFGF